MSFQNIPRSQLIELQRKKREQITKLNSHLSSINTMLLNKKKVPNFKTPRNSPAVKPVRNVSLHTSKQRNKLQHALNGNILQKQHAEIKITTLPHIGSSVLIPKPALLQFQKLQPTFDWGKAVWHAAKTIPGVETLGDAYQNFKEGYHHAKKWYHEHVEKHLFGDKNNSVEKSQKNIIKNSMNTKIQKAKEKILASLDNPKPIKILDNSTAVGHKILTFEEAKLQTFTDEKHDSIMPPPYDIISKQNRNDLSVTQPWKSTNIIATIPAAAYVTGQVILAVMVTPDLLDQLSSSTANNYELMIYKKLLVQIECFAPTSQGGGFIGFFDPDPAATWEVGQNGILGIQKAR